MEDEDKQTIRVIKGKIHQPLYTNEREYERRRGKYFEDTRRECKTVLQEERGTENITKSNVRSYSKNTL